MFRIAICDDCPHQTQDLFSLLDSYKAGKPEIEIFTKTFTSGQDLTADLDAGASFELYLLDILMPGQNGITLARLIRERDADVPIIFLTSSPDYALDAFGVSAVQYILKPIDTKKLFSTLNKILDAKQAEHGQYLMFPAVGSVVKVLFNSIVCVELFGRSVKVYLANGNVLLSKTIRTSFYEAVGALRADNRFLQPHKSYVINMAWVEVLTGKSFLMKHDIDVPIPRYRYAEIKTRYFAWLSQCGISKIGVSRND